MKESFGMPQQNEGIDKEQIISSLIQEFSSDEDRDLLVRYIKTEKANDGSREELKSQYGRRFQELSRRISETMMTLKMIHADLMVELLRQLNPQETSESIENPKIKAHDFLNAEARNPNYSPELRLFIGSVIGVINEGAEVSDGQQKHIASILRNRGERLVSKGYTSTPDKEQLAEKYDAFDEFITNLATFINSCK